MGEKAFVRKCDTCGMTTAIDIDPTPEHWHSLCLYGQTIHVVSITEAMELWKVAGQCACKHKPTESLLI